MKISVCIPMYNESGIIAATAGTLTEALELRLGGTMNWPLRTKEAPMGRLDSCHR